MALQKSSVKRRGPKFEPCGSVEFGEYYRNDRKYSCARFFHWSEKKLDKHFTVQLVQIFLTVFLISHKKQLNESSLLILDI